MISITELQRRAGKYQTKDDPESKSWNTWVKANDSNHAGTCDVCLDSNTYPGRGKNDHDYLVYCDGCNAMVHKSCYGKERFEQGFISRDKLSEEDLKLFPEKDGDPWLCERCLAL